MKNWGYVLAGAVAAFIITSVSPGIAAAPEPGSSADPVVTKSYVDQAMKNASVPNAVLEVNAGDTLVGYQGTEMIVREGANTAVAYSPNSSGLSDLTGGADILSGQAIQPNHLILFPRSDGRAIKITGHTYVIIMGAYTKS